VKNRWDTSLIRYKPVSSQTLGVGLTADFTREEKSLDTVSLV